MFSKNKSISDEATNDELLKRYLAVDVYGAPDPFIAPSHITYTTKTKSDGIRVVYTPIGTIAKINKKEIKKKIPDEIKNKIKGLKIIPFNTNKNKIKQRPTMEDGTIPRHPSSIIINGRSGSGKTQIIVNLLCMPHFYGAEKGHHYFNEIHLFSPTAGEMDDLSQHLLSYTPLQRDQIHNEIDTEEIFNILEEAKDDIKKNGIDKAKRRLIILDDIQSDRQFLNSKEILKCFTMNRHYNTSVWLCSQSFKLTPRSCRLQCNNVIFFKGSNSELDILKEEFCPSGCNKKKFDKLITHALDGDHSFLHINMREPDEKKYRKCFEEIINLSDYMS